MGHTTRVITITLAALTLTGCNRGNNEAMDAMMRSDALNIGIQAGLCIVLNGTDNELREILRGVPSLDPSVPQDVLQQLEELPFEEYERLQLEREDAILEILARRCPASASQVNGYIGAAYRQFGAPVASVYESHFFDAITSLAAVESTDKDALRAYFEGTYTPIGLDAAEAY